MNQVATLTVRAESEVEFEKLLARAGALSGLIAKFERNGKSYQALVLLRFSGDPETLVMSMDFDATALRILGVDLDGRGALLAAEAATVH